MLSTNDSYESISMIGMGQKRPNLSFSMSIGYPRVGLASSKMSTLDTEQTSLLAISLLSCALIAFSLGLSSFWAGIEPLSGAFSLQSVQDSIMSSAEQGAKLEKKLALHLGGYQKRQKMLRDKISEAAEALEKATFALSAFKSLAISEEVAITRRLDALREEANFISRRERENG